MQQEAKRSAAIHTVSDAAGIHRDTRANSQAGTRHQRARVERRESQARPRRNHGCAARCGCLSRHAAEAFRRLRIWSGRACADRFRTRSRLRQHRMVRHARGLLRLDDGILPARSAAGGLGRHRQSARGVLYADAEGRGGRRRHQDFGLLALGQRRRQRHLAHPRRDDSEQGRAARAGLVPGPGP